MAFPKWLPLEPVAGGSQESSGEAAAGREEEAHCEREGQEGGGLRDDEHAHFIQCHHAVSRGEIEIDLLDDQSDERERAVAFSR